MCEWLTFEGTKGETVDLSFPLADATALRAGTTQEVGRVTNAPCLLDLPYLEQVNVGDTDDVSAELRARLDRHTSENLQRNRTSAPPIQR